MMHISLTIVFCLFASVCFAKDVVIERAYTGRYSALHYIGVNEASQVLREHKNQPPLVIRNQEDYEYFIKGIPKKAFGAMMDATEDNKDPLLKIPSIDFDNKMMIAVFRYNFYVSPKITRITETGEKVIVTYEFPPLGKYEIGNRDMMTATYMAVVVKRIDKKVEFIKNGI